MGRILVVERVAAERRNVQAHEVGPFLGGAVGGRHQGRHDGEILPAQGIGGNHRPALEGAVIEVEGDLRQGWPGGGDLRPGGPESGGPLGLFVLLLRQGLLLHQQDRAALRASTGDAAGARAAYSDGLAVEPGCGACLAALALFVTHGAIFLNLKSTDPIRHRAMSVVKSIGPVATLMIVLFVLATYTWTGAFARLGANPGLLPITAVIAMLGAGAFVHRARMGWAFLMTSLAMAAATGTIFRSLYPRVMVSSLNPDWSLTIYNAASTPYTLKIMSIVAVVFVPIVLAYQGWTYWVFRHRIGHGTHLEY